MRVVLSRKGFDSVAGRGASPIMGDGRMVSMPIPEWQTTAAPDGPTFEDTMVPGTEPTTYAELGRRCRLRAATGPAHVDPDLVPGARPRLEGWRASLGQADAAAGHLRNQNVGPGDLFLFFGLYAPLGPRGLRRHDWFHALFGYLQIAEVLDLHAQPSIPDWLSDHPHLSAGAMATYRPNLLYVSRERLDFAPDQPGWGVFNYQPDLRLTPAGATTRTELELPACFGPDAGTTVSYLPGHLWSDIGGERVRVEFRGNKQEMVCSGSEATADWARELVMATPRWAPAST
mgnify:CR=1 FL=1